MKRKVIIFYIILFIAIMLIFVFHSNFHSFEFYMDESEIAKIDIVETTEDGGTIVLKELPVESDILQRIKNIRFGRTFPPDYSIIGKGILITYRDSSCELIQYNCRVYYKNSEKNFGNDSCDYEVFMRLLNEYILN